MNEIDEYQKLIEHIFRLDKKNLERLITRESSTVEFKESFHGKGKWDEYCKTMASFANNKGGVIVFGIKRKPHDLIGLNNSYFEDYDTAELSTYLNSRFAPEIIWSKHSHNVYGKVFGLILVRESQNKPVIAICNGSNIINESDIFYRYNAYNKKIKYPELKHILEENRRKEQELWMSHLQHIASIGVHNAAIFNPDNGIITGKSGVFVIDKQLLSKISFIREGEFQEVKGAPVIRIVGEAQFIGVGKFKGTESIERQAIRLEQILEFFLLQKKPSEPKYFIQAACYELTCNLPIYYFSEIAKIDLSQLKDIVAKENPHFQKGKTKLLERLNKKDVNLFQEISNTNSDSSIKKKSFRMEILSKSMNIPSEEADVKYCLQTIRNLTKSEIDIDYLFPKVYTIYQQYWGNGGNLRSEIYKAVCHLDKEMFCPIDFYTKSHN